VKAAILTIGDELTCGYQLDTNSQVIARRLAALSIDVVTHLSVSDDLQAIRTGIHVARHVAQSDDEPSTVIVSGGLGPTEDDLTRRAIAAYFDRPLIEDDAVLAAIRERFDHRGYAMPESNRIQAQIPQGAEVIHNSRGTAAGFYFVAGSQHIFAVPGVPDEMEAMLKQFILPRLRELVAGGRYVRRAVTKVYGVPESEINERIRPLLRRDRNPLLGLLPHRGTIDIEIVAAGQTPEEAEALIETDLEALRAEFGRSVVSDDGRDLPQVVVDLLADRSMTLAVAEVGTAGLVMARLTECEATRGSFAGGAVVNDHPAAGGDGLAHALAAREATVADVGLGVGEVILAADAPTGRPYGTVDVALNCHGEEVARQFRFNGDRLRVRQWVVDAALSMVRDALEMIDEA